MSLGVAMLLVIIAMIPMHAKAQAGAPIFCDAQFYQTRLNTGGTGTRLLRYPTFTSTPVNFYSGNNTTTTVPGLGATELNGLGFNARDGYMYAISANTTGGTLGIYRLGASGGELVGNLPGVSDPWTATAGVFDKAGNYYFAGQATIGGVPSNVISPSVIYRVDNIPTTGTFAGLTIARSYAINITPLLNFGDFAFSDTNEGVNGILYGTTNQGTTNTHVRIQLNNAASTAAATTISFAGGSIGGVGSAFYDQPSDIYYVFSNVNNSFYQISNFVSGTPAATTVSAALNAPLTDNTGTSDGTSCIFAGAQQGDIGVTKTVAPLTPRTVGQTVTFTVAAFNVGPSPAQSVTIADLLPGGFTLVSAATTAGAYFSGTGNWVISNLPSTARQTLTLVATVSSLGTTTNSFVNVASVSGSNQAGTTTVIPLTDPVLSNNTASATVTTARSANLSITKTDGVGTVTAGTTISYTITVSLGTATTASDVANAVLKDPAAAGLQCVIGSPACTTSGTAGSICPTLGAGAGQLSMANLQGVGVLIPLLKPGGQMAFKVDCGVTATGQ